MINFFVFSSTVFFDAVVFDTTTTISTSRLLFRFFVYEKKQFEIEIFYIELKYEFLCWFQHSNNVDKNKIKFTQQQGREYKVYFANLNLSAKIHRNWIAIEKTKSCRILFSKMINYIIKIWQKKKFEIEKLWWSMTFEFLFDFFINEII
jgi:hypothetical protein